MISKAVERERVHDRSITLQGYRREDGLFDIEGEMTDTKTYAFPNSERGEIKAGEAIHHMRVRVTIDANLEIVAAEAETLAGPYGICPQATRVFERLVGLKIGPGWRRGVRTAIGGIEGCTHITELMAPIATVAYQTLFGERARAKRMGKTLKGDSSDAAVGGLVNSCLGHAEDPEAVLAGDLPK